MKRTALMLLLALSLTAGLVGPAQAMPAGEEPKNVPKSEDSKADLFDHVVESQRAAPARYRTMREERLEELSRSAERGAGMSDHVPGWKITQRQEPEESTKSNGLYILLLVGAGVALSLALRVFAPFIFDRKPRLIRSDEPLTMTLKPREERKYRRA